MKKYLYGHTSQETAYTVENYPWGFRLKTTIRYWIESKVGFGQRFGSQTIDPKTGFWCKPKYSTYSGLVFMYLDENDHVKNEALSHYSHPEEFVNFGKLHVDNMEEYQLNLYNKAKNYLEKLNNKKILAA